MAGWLLRIGMFGAALLLMTCSEGEPKTDSGAAGAVDAPLGADDAMSFPDAPLAVDAAAIDDASLPPDGPVDAFIPPDTGGTCTGGVQCGATCCTDPTMTFTLCCPSEGDCGVVVGPLCVCTDGCP